MVPTGISSLLPEARALRSRARDSVGDSGVAGAVGFCGAGFLDGSMGGCVEGVVGRGGLFSGLGFLGVAGIRSAAFFCFSAVFLCKSQAREMA